METLQFKTNIKCSGCVSKATPFLNNTAGANNWLVDVQSNDKVLTVVKKGIASSDAIIQSLAEAGFQAHLIGQE